MIFSSYEFIFLFLPITFIGFFIACRFSHTLAICWLVLCSFFFYGWWDVSYLPLIAGSMLFNYAMGTILGRGTQIPVLTRRVSLVFGIIVNLLLLGIYKYTDFIIENFNEIASSEYRLLNITLPLAISFFTFQQIAFLVDAFKGKTSEYSFLHYSLFVTFFPQLIAGPIVHHKEMLPQFTNSNNFKIRYLNLIKGLTIFIIGWFKKSVIADGIAPYSNKIFDMALLGNPVTFFDAWGGSLAYTFQLYFDFSGYADMAVGGAMCFNIRLPINFNAPYKATSIIDFWRRWHMTLSRFLRDYIYIPLGGNRKGKMRRYVNLLSTMILGGIWHGAGWTFFFWGLLHGIYLMINQAWSSWVEQSHLLKFCTNRTGYRIFSWALTFLCVVVSWVYFRAESFEAANIIISGMVGRNGIVIPLSIAHKIPLLYSIAESIPLEFKSGIGKDFVLNYLWIGFGFIVALAMPTSQQLIRLRSVSNKQHRYSPALFKFSWRPTFSWALILGTITVISTLALSQVGEFLYFQF